MFASPPRDFLYIAYKLDAEYQDDLGATKSIVGTGFVLASDSRPILVTNRHVVDAEYFDAKFKNFRLIKLIASGSHSDNTRYSIELSLQQPFLFSRARENDVACLVDVQAKVAAGFQMYHHIRTSDLATEDEFSNHIWAGDQVYLAGYPDVHDKSEQRPILRAGVIASDPRFNYSYTGRYEGERVAYEAMSTAGASGGPVYATARGIGNIHTHLRRDLLVGVNAGHIANMTGHSGMSYFVKATVIREILSDAGVAC